jgi:hypothetical protein
MKTTRFKIEGREIIQLDSQRLIGIVGQDKFQIEFADDDWENLHKTMKLIKPDGTILYLALVNDEAILTQNCYSEGMTRLGFFGTINEDDPENMAIASTNYLPIYIYEHAYSSNSSEASNIPTPTQWDIIIGQMNNVVDEMKDIKADTNQIKEDTEQLKQDTQGIKDDVQTIKGEVQEIQTDITNKANNFDTNYTDKLNLFNANATSKTNSFDNNATQKTTDFNSNASLKSSDFNSNATNKTNDFNSNASSKTTTFNNNATSKTTSFNNNATSKTTAFNENYTEKVGEVNGIITDFKAYVETVDYNYNNLQNKPQTWSALIGEVE